MTGLRPARRAWVPADRPEPVGTGAEEAGTRRGTEPEPSETGPIPGGTWYARRKRGNRWPRGRSRCAAGGTWYARREPVRRLPTAADDRRLTGNRRG